MDATQLELLGRVIRGLEKNLATIEAALEFVAGLDDGEFTEYFIQLDYIDNALTAWFQYEGDLGRIKRVIADLRMNAPVEAFGGDPLLPLPAFQPGADRVIKAFDTQLNLACDLMRINPPARDAGDIAGTHPTMTHWGKYEKRNLAEVRNIIEVGRGLLGD